VTKPSDPVRFRIERGLTAEELVAAVATRLPEEAEALRQRGWRTVRRSALAFRVVRPAQRPWPKTIAGLAGRAVWRPLEFVVESFFGTGPASRRMQGQFDQMIYGVDTDRADRARRESLATLHAGAGDERLDGMIAQGRLEYVGVAALEREAATELIVEARGEAAVALAQGLARYAERASEGELRRRARR